MKASDAKLLASAAIFLGRQLLKCPELAIIDFLSDLSAVAIKMNRLKISIDILKKAGEQSVAYLEAVNDFTKTGSRADQIRCNFNSYLESLYPGDLYIAKFQVEFMSHLDGGIITYLKHPNLEQKIRLPRSQ